MENSGRNIIVRKIRLFIDIPNEKKEELNNAFRRIYDWQEMAYRASNLVATNLYIQDKSKELLYFHDDVRVKLANRSKDAEGVLTSSRENSTYRVLSSKFKNELPAAIFSSLNRSVYKNYISEKNEYFSGKRSLRSYKKNLPIPFNEKSIYSLRYDEEIKNFRFSLFKDKRYYVPFRTYLGSDRSNNKIIFDRCISGEYKMCESKIRVADGKIFLYLTVEIPPSARVVNPEIIATAKLSFMVPVVITLNEKEHMLGDKGSFIYKRLAIKQGLEYRQKSMKYNKGGRGRKHKTQGVEEFRVRERNFVNTYMQTLSFSIVKYCIDNKIGKLVIDNTDQCFEEAKEYPFVLRNWSYGNLLEKLEYKCKRNSINLEIV